MQTHLGAIVRGDTTRRSLAVVFTGDSFAEGIEEIASVLETTGSKASFFFTGNFYRNPDFSEHIRRLVSDGHYLGAHSDRHLLYCDWENRDSLLVTRSEFEDDLVGNYREMQRFGIEKADALFYLPPYEWYNKTIADWTKEQGLTLVNFTSGTRSNADYTTEEMGDRFVSSEVIFDSILERAKNTRSGLNGYLLLLHVGAGPGRIDKFHLRFAELVAELRSRGYRLERIDELLGVRPN